MKSLLLSSSILLLAIGMVAPATETTAAISAALDGKTKINLSGRQRMLSQRMAKAVCFVTIGVQTKEHLQILEGAEKLFQQTLEGLSKGDEKQGMLPESNPEILADLGKVVMLWADYRAVNDSIIASGAVSKDQLNTVASVNLPVLKQMHKTVGTIEKVYGSSGEVHPALALALNISGRQRMLSQKASKEFCLIAAGVDVEANRAALKETTELFTVSLDGLIRGNPETALAPAPTPEIKAQLDKVQNMWEPMRKVFLQTANGIVPSPAEVEKIATDNEALLNEMNKAVSMYNTL